MKNPFENIVIPITLAIALIGYTLIVGGDYSLFLTPSFLFSFLITYFAYILLTLSYTRIYRFIEPNNTFKFYYLRLIIGFIAYYLVLMSSVFLLLLFSDIGIDNLDAYNALKNRVLADNYIILSTSFIMMLIIYFSFLFYKHFQENKLKEQKIIAGTANAKFESLKNQIDPHFLFNSLNVLSALIEENPANAQRFTTSLSKIYRYVLEQKDKELVSVQEELAFAETYMNLLKMRFENSISFELPENFEQPEAKVVPLSLQLLLENCIKHNMASEQKPLHIKIFEKDNFLVVQNDLQKKAVLQDGKGVGLQNIISRYAILTNRKVIIQQNSTVFAVYLPILTKQISIMKDTKTTPNTAYYRAKKRVEELKGFYGNLIAYCCVIPILIFINLTYNPDFHWFWFSAAGWGFGVIMHALQVFGYGSSWEERKVNEILNKSNPKNSWN
jgi:hypothetical protein